MTFEPRFSGSKKILERRDPTTAAILNGATSQQCFEGQDADRLTLKPQWSGVFDTCTFKKIIFSSGSQLNCQFVNCSFEHCVFNGPTLFNKSFFSACRFVACDFEGLSWCACKFFNTDFLNSNLASLGELVALDGCYFDSRCRIASAEINRGQMDIDSVSSLLCAVRRTRWNRWYSRHKYLSFPMSLFWEVSCYGTSARRLITVSIALILGFSQLYLAPWYLGNEPAVKDLHVGDWKNASFSCFWETQLRAIYFAVVTGTTVGYGDHSATTPYGHVVAICQIVIFYLVFGAILARVSSMMQE
jgi:hypothetical protein